MIDSLLKNIERSKKSTIHNDLGISNDRYAVLTLHRPSNVDDEESFRRILAALESVERKFQLFFPCTPEQRIELKNSD